MAWESPLDPTGTPKAHLIATCEWIFLAIYTCELLIKVAAYGFMLHRHTYLRNPWCQVRINPPHPPDLPPHLSSLPRACPPSATLTSITPPPSPPSLHHPHLPPSATLTSLPPPLSPPPGSSTLPSSASHGCPFSSPTPTSPTSTSSAPSVRCVPSGLSRNCRACRRWSRPYLGYCRV